MRDALFAPGMLVFTVPALLGSAVLVLKIGLLLAGGLDGDADLDVDADVDVDAAIDGGDSTSAFTFLSVQSIAALLMGFGWAGLIGAVTLEWSLGASAGLGLAGGGLLMWLLGLLLKAVYDLQSSGHVRIDEAIGAEGSVYLGIPRPGEGRGQVRVVIGERARFYDAYSMAEPIATGARVRVVRVNDDNTLTVATT